MRNQTSSRHWRYFWISVILIWATGLVCSNLAWPATWPVAQPVLDQQITELIDSRSDDNTCQIFSVDLSQQAISNGIAWYLIKNPKVPISQPYVEITPAGLKVKAFVQILGMRLPIFVDLAVYLEKGELGITILDMGAAGTRLPDSVTAVFQNEVQSQLDALQKLPVKFSRLDLQIGKVIVGGTLE